MTVAASCKRILSVLLPRILWHMLAIGAKNRVPLRRVNDVWESTYDADCAINNGICFFSVLYHNCITIGNKIYLLRSNSSSRTSTHSQ